MTNITSGIKLDFRSEVAQCPLVEIRSTYKHTARLKSKINHLFCTSALSCHKLHLFLSFNTQSAGITTHSRVLGCSASPVQGSSGLSGTLRWGQFYLSGHQEWKGGVKGMFLYLCTYISINLTYLFPFCFFVLCLCAFVLFLFPSWD